VSLLGQEEKARLDVVGVYHVGEFINSFRHGSLVMREEGSAESVVLSTLLFATVHGVIGVVAQLSPKKFERFETLQKAMQKVCWAYELPHWAHVY
jgi:DNA damage-binding protein 1